MSSWTSWFVLSGRLSCTKLSVCIIVNEFCRIHWQNVRNKSLYFSYHSLPCNSPWFFVLVCIFRFPRSSTPSRLLADTLSFSSFQPILHTGIHNSFYCSFEMQLSYRCGAKRAIQILWTYGVTAPSSGFF